MVVDAGGSDQDAASGVVSDVRVTCEQMDVLFVIDNSASMQQEQQNLSDNFDRFVESLRRFQEGTVDFRIGVTTTQFPNLGSELGVIAAPAWGALLKLEGMTEPWLSSSDPELTTKFRALATVGTDAVLDEQPLKAMRSALVDRIADGSNASFLRPNALLALVVLTDGDDLSKEGESDDFNSNSAGPIPVSRFISAFDSIKGRRGYWSAAVFAGGTAPTCTSRFGSALFAARLQDFVDLSGRNAVFSSICDGDLSAGLDSALATFSDACEFLLF